MQRHCLGCKRLIARGSRCVNCRRKVRHGWAWTEIRALVIDRDKWCRRCGGTVALEVHHVVPLIKGGSNDLGNLVTLCSACHRGAHRMRA